MQPAASIRRVSMVTGRTPLLRPAWSRGLSPESCGPELAAVLTVIGDEDDVVANTE
jgi:hypothetical protein